MGSRARREKPAAKGWKTKRMVTAFRTMVIVSFPPARARIAGSIVYPS